MQTLNVYGFGIQRKSDIASGQQGGANLAIIASSPEAARAALIAYVAADLAKISGPTIIVAGALYDGSGEAPPPTEPPVNRDVPHLQGSGVVGQTLNCTMGNWDGEPTSYAYQWLSDGEVVTGSGADYVVKASDSGQSITCIVTATNAAGSTEAPVSNVIFIEAAARSRKH